MGFCSPDVAGSGAEPGETATATVRNGLEDFAEATAFWFADM